MVHGPEPLALGELGALLWAGAGITAQQEGFALRTAPSAGGLYPIEHYVVANEVEGLEQGLYHYDVRGRALERLSAGDLRLPVARAALDERIAAEAQAVFDRRRRWSARAGSTASAPPALRAARRRPHRREHRPAAPTALGLGTRQIAAFFDEEAADILGVDPDARAGHLHQHRRTTGPDLAPEKRAAPGRPTEAPASQAATSAKTCSRPTSLKSSW